MILQTPTLWLPGWAPSGTPRALDAYTSGLWAAWGLKRLRSSWTGPLIRARRASDDAEMDVGYITGGPFDGDLDAAPMLSWAAGADVFLVRKYDQQGNTRDLYQPTKAKQPRLASGGIYPGWWEADGVDDILPTTVTLPANGVHSVAGRYAFRSYGSGAFTVWSLTSLGFPGHNSWGYQYQSDLSSIVGYIFDGGTNYLALFFPDPGSAEAVDLTIADRSESGNARFRSFRDGVEQTFGVAHTDSLGTDFTAETLTIASFDGSQASPINGKWFAVWETSQAANGAGITGAL